MCVSHLPHAVGRNLGRSWCGRDDHFRCRRSLVFPTPAGPKLAMASIGHIDTASIAERPKGLSTTSISKFTNAHVHRHGASWVLPQRTAGSSDGDGSCAYLVPVRSEKSTSVHPHVAVSSACRQPRCEFECNLLCLSVFSFFCCDIFVWHSS